MVQIPAIDRATADASRAAPAGRCRDARRPTGQRFMRGPVRQLVLMTVLNRASVGQLMMTTPSPESYRLPGEDLAPPGDGPLYYM